MRLFTTAVMSVLMVIACHQMLTPPSPALAFSSHSSFTTRSSSASLLRLPFATNTGYSSPSAAWRQSKRSTALSAASSLVMYDSSFERRASTPGEQNVWSVLSNTEKWISTTLASAGNNNNNNGNKQEKKNANSTRKSASSSSGPASSASKSSSTGAADAAANNPYSRKEVSYVCDAHSDGSMIVAGLFRRLKEARERGEMHGKNENAMRLRARDQEHEDPDAPPFVYRPSTLRQTQVMVIPSHASFTQNFTIFDMMMDRVSRARRNARDYVTDHRLDDDISRWNKLDEFDDDNDETSHWAVSVNCAHLHPKYGEKTPQQTLSEMKRQEDQIEVDVNLQDFKEKRLKARQSPYPTVVIEVRSQPPPKPATTSSSSSAVTARDIQKLEALFGKSAYKPEDDDQSSDASSTSNRKKKEHDFYDNIGKTTNLLELTALTPLHYAQNWIAQHEDAVQTQSPSFTETSASHVDEAYEFFFTNLAMMMTNVRGDGTTSQQQQFFMVMPHFLSSAATSFERWSMEIMNIVETIPDVPREIMNYAGDDETLKLSIRAFHPEHVDMNMRSPMPILCLQMITTKMGSSR